MTALAIQTQNLSRDFGTVHALSDLSLDIPRGMVFGFLGRNGAGKTTTIRLLLGLLEASSGTATVLGYDIHHQANQIREHTGALLEHNGLYERLSAEDNLEFYGRIYHLNRQERHARIEELLTHLDLWDRRTEMVRDWSKGMRQKLAIARTLLHRPSLVFLDEPTSGLDPVASAALRDDITRLVQHEGVTVFLTTHNLPEAEKLCDQVGIIHQGSLQALGSPSQLRAQAGRPRVEIYGHGFNDSVLATLRDTPDIGGVAQQNGHITLDLHREINVVQLVETLGKQGVHIEEIRRSAASLEDAFLQLVGEEAEEAKDQEEV